MSIKNNFKRLIFLIVAIYNIIRKVKSSSISAENRLYFSAWASFQIRLRVEKEKSIPKARLCKNGNLKLNAESKDSKTIAFPSFGAASMACAA